MALRAVPAGDGLHPENMGSLKIVIFHVMLA